MERDPEETLLRDIHVAFFKRFLNLMGSSLSNWDTTRLSIAFFAINGLEILNALDEAINDDYKHNICDWIYRLQIIPGAGGDSAKCGFQGSDTFHILVDGEIVHCNPSFATGHLAMTYTGLSSLLMLGDDLSRVNRNAILLGIQTLQQKDGSFSAVQMGSETDMRFVYCACCICYILKDWTFIDAERTVNYIKNSMSYDYGFGQGPDLESHGGVTYCAVASLFLMGRLHTSLTKVQIRELRKWALMRQVAGFQGRANKQEDTCYSFWVGATLKMLDFFDKVDYKRNRDYIMTTQHAIVGGFSKWKDLIPDPLHTYLGLAGLSFMGEEGLLEVDPALNISKRAVNYLYKLQNSWKS